MSSATLTNANVLFWLRADTAGPLETSNGNSLPTAAVIGLPLGSVAVVLFIGCVVYYVRTERGGRRKERSRLAASSLTPHQQRHDIINKDLGGVGVATPCLPPEHAHRLTLPPNNPPTYHPYSVIFANLNELSSKLLQRYLVTVSVTITRFLAGVSIYRVG